MTAGNDGYSRQRQHLVGVRLSPEEFAAVKLVAERLGLSPPTVLRMPFERTAPAPSEGICMVCGRSIRLNKDGRMKYHVPTPHRPQVNCRGSRALPAPGGKQ